MMKNLNPNNCPVCKKDFIDKRGQNITNKRTYCSKACNNRARSKYFKYGHKTIHNGYIMILKPNHPLAGSNGYIKEHRYVMEQYLGRILERSEIIHHINHDKLDNRIENLVLTNRAEHLSQNHPRERDNHGRFICN